MKKIFRSALLLLFPALHGYAQSSDPVFHFGMKISPNMSWLKSDTKEIDSDGSIARFAYGVITEFRFAENYAFATGIDIDYRGGKLKGESSSVINDTTTTVVSSSTYKLQYIELPLTLKLKTNEIGQLRYYLQVGVAPGFNIRARGDGKVTTQVRSGSYSASSVTEFEDEDLKKDDDNDINNLIVSMVIGAGVEYNLSGTTNIFGGLTFSNGFTDVSDSKSVKLFSNYLGLNIGVLF